MNLTCPSPEAAIERRFATDNPAALQARVRPDTDPAAVGVDQRDPDDRVESGDVPWFRLLHPVPGEAIYRGRMHGLRSGSRFPDGYRAKFVRMLNPGEVRRPGFLAITCGAGDRGAITEDEIRNHPDLPERMRIAYLS